MHYNLPPTYTIAILRSSLKPIYELTDEEYKQKVHMFKSILDMHMDQRMAAVTEEKQEMNIYFDERAYINSIKEDHRQSMSPRLYTLFWYMSLTNLYVPDDIYKDQVKKLTK